MEILRDLAPYEKDGEEVMTKNARSLFRQVRKSLSNPRTV
jgi:hypothetical protein